MSQDQGLELRALELRSLEGRRAGLALRDGSRIDDCQFVAAPRGDLTRVWVSVDGADLFVPVEEIRDAWEAPRRDAPRREPHLGR